MADATPQPLRFVSVKFAPVGRTQTYTLDDDPTARVPRVGESVIVQTENGPAIGTVDAAHRTDGRTQAGRVGSLAARGPSRVARGHRRADAPPPA